MAPGERGHLELAPAGFLYRAGSGPGQLSRAQLLLLSSNGPRADVATYRTLRTGKAVQERLTGR